MVEETGVPGENPRIAVNSYKKQELLTLREHPSSSLVFLVGSVLLMFLIFSVAILCVSMF